MVRHKKTVVTTVRSEAARVEFQVPRAVGAGEVIQVPLNGQVLMVRVDRAVRPNGKVAILVPQTSILVPQTPACPPVATPYVPPVATPLQGGASPAAVVAEVDVRANVHETTAVVVQNQNIQNIQNQEERRAGCFFNGVLLSEAEKLLLRQHGNAAHDGRWWYDARSGAYGHLGGPCLAFMAPGLAVGGPHLDPACSAGISGVFVNGRQLNDADTELWATYVDDKLPPGRYALDANGDVYDELDPRRIKRQSAKPLLFFKRLLP